MTARAIPSETLYRWREAIDSVLRTPLSYDAAGDPVRRLAQGTFVDLTAASHELREAWLSTLVAEEEAIDVDARHKEQADARGAAASVELEGRSRE